MKFKDFFTSRTLDSSCYGAQIVSDGDDPSQTEQGTPVETIASSVPNNEDTDGN